MYNTNTDFQRPSLKRYLGSIIVVDDETDIGQLFQIYLVDAGYNVDVYNDPVKAFSQFEPGKYDLALLDVRMPHMNGFELYQRLKKIDIGCKFCFITAFETYYNSLKEFFPSLDITCYIQKPVSRQELLDRVEKELQNKHNK